MKHIIDLETFERKDSYAFFQTFVDPNVTITSEVDCTGAKERARQHGIPFFLYYIHAMIKAANEIKEYKYRIDKEGRIIYYDEIHVLTLIKTSETGDYNTVLFNYNSDLLTFAANAIKKIENRPVDTDPFTDETNIIENDELNVLMISVIPGLSFSSINFALRTRDRGFYPVSLVGKMMTKEGKEYLPIGLTANHTFIDGFHLERYFSRVAELLQQ